MIFGYNTDVKVGESVYHVQTEDHGVKQPVIDSVVYYKGQVLDRRRTSYVPEELSPEQVQELATQQHRDLVDAIKTGAFVPGVQQEMAASLAVELLNPEEIAQNGRLMFRLRVPSGTRVQAFLEVNGGEAERAEAIADSSGKAEVAFLLPEQPEASVLFRAVTESATQTLKFVVKQQ